MFNLLKQWDRQLFIAVNTGCTNRLFDAVLPWTRYPQHWIFLYVLLFIYLVYIYKLKVWLPALSLLLAVLLSDQWSATVIKHAIRRLRPCNNPEMAGIVHLRVEHCGSGFSFVSSHASNHFAIGTFLLLLFFPKFKYMALLWILWAATISFAQVYVGVHYPIDIICGGLLGIFIGFITFKGMRLFEKKLWHLDL